jgi:hypothetical protein
MKTLASGSLIAWIVAFAVLAAETLAVIIRLSLVNMSNPAQAIRPATFRLELPRAR